VLTDTETLLITQRLVINCEILLSGSTHGRSRWTNKTVTCHTRRFGQGKYCPICHKRPGVLWFISTTTALASLTVSHSPVQFPLPYTNLPELKLANSSRRLQFSTEFICFVCKVMYASIQTAFPRQLLVQPIDCLPFSRR
jgi:hypothetical protein